ncbi:HNH endonuclease family protein [Sphingomonas sp. MMS24-J13]|uniref:HNH endonuclease family protein n=1 Tax=Sphingomonas sp. MMS24-J13 TaxID=3238686 RepID=UPI00384C17A9
MIQRADFATEDGEYTMDLFQNFNVSNLESGSPVRGLMRKPDFQRETNHWTPAQVTTFIASFLDNELIPSLILWKSSSYIFVIDGGHRLSALRAWIEDDYGDGAISQVFYGGEISDDQKRLAKRTRAMVEARIGRFSKLKSIVGSTNSGSELDLKRAHLLFTRGLNLQWVQGTASVAETSFFKINSQGTPLDDTEELLLRNRKKPIAVGARAILRAGGGHKYWSSFSADAQKSVEAAARQLFEVLFDPEVSQPIKTLDLPLGGSVSPLDALSLLIEFLSIADSTQTLTKGIAGYDDDPDGSTTVAVLQNALSVAKRITGNSNGSLGLHPAVYFYNERGKHSRFLFLGMVLLISRKIKDNDGGFFGKFVLARERMEKFLIENKSLIGILLQNMSKQTRVSKMRDLYSFLIENFADNKTVKVEEAIEHLGARGRILDITTAANNTVFSDETKSALFVKRALDSAIKCNICHGLLDPAKSVSYDHVTPVREGGTGDVSNGDLVHPYCNQSVKC